jgi:hypothetical protein
MDVNDHVRSFRPWILAEMSEAYSLSAPPCATPVVG